MRLVGEPECEVGGPGELSVRLVGELSMRLSVGSFLRLSAMQKIVVEQDSKKHVPLQPTHFFHLDPSEGV